MIDLPPALRFAVVTGLVLVISTSLSCLTYRFIELPGQALGRRVTTRVLAGDRIMLPAVLSRRR